MRNLAVLACLLALSGQARADAPVARKSVVANTFAASALLGMQLAVQSASQQGKVPAAVNQCIQGLTPTSMLDLYIGLLKDNLTPEELQTAEAFFRTPTGEKYAEYGMLQAYTSTGQVPPKPLPTFSTSEAGELAAFTRTSAGTKLILNHVLQTGSAQQAVLARIQELLTTCNAKH